VITAWALLLWIPQLALFGNEIFTTETPFLDANPVMVLVLVGLNLLELVAAVWVVVAFIKCVAEAQRFSAWRALANSVVAGLLMIAPFVIVGVVIAIVRS
jgi:hypothetical protein